MQAQQQQQIIERLTGVVTFKAPVYKQIADDTAGTNTAMIVVIVIAVVVGVLGAILSGIYGFIGTLIFRIVTVLLWWALGAWLLSFVANQFFQGKTNTAAMMRVTAYTSVFQIVSIIPIIGIIGSILQVIANIIAIREAAGFDTTKALLTAIVAGVVMFIVIAIIGVIFGAIFFASMAITR